MSSVREIASRVGVSVATVSRVINNDPRVSEAMRDRVLAMAWLIRARSAGSKLAERYLKAARNGLTADENAEAERRAALPLAESAP